MDTSITSTLITESPDDKMGVLNLFYLGAQPFHYKVAPGPHSDINTILNKLVLLLV